ncbi:MAG TPA: methylmalonyl Co-A mutase-associated GTPase MeaB, partial [Bacteroidetes bacterium]|nr:methylmalonyl Co-A mutase-associated GTPase MeaB [Bacteroidota bacterium]
ITGAPGVGKSTLLEQLGLYAIGKGFKPAVLAIDPSSSLSGGSILGDKTRMSKLSMSDNAFIRPSPAGKNLGGVAKKTSESIIAVECAGFNPVFVETVGVGQSEITVHSMTDLFILLIQPGAGDDIQGIKRGIMEMADIIVINKADGDNIQNANKTLNQYSGIISLLPEKENSWKTKIITVSALSGKGINVLWDMIMEYENTIKSSGFYYKNRKKQNLMLFKDYLFNNLMEIFNSTPELKKIYAETKEKVENGSMSYYDAGDFLLSILLK